MVNQNVIAMKQPQLGQMIQQWRKGKGMTQEELVERCNINVRTIQRIEAGEVTPRPFTVKAILEALEINSADIHDFKVEDQAEKAASVQSDWLRYAYAIGIAYLVLAVTEGAVDIRLWMDDAAFGEGFSIWYTLLKVAVLVLFSAFMLAYFRLGERWGSPLMKVTSALLVGISAVFIFEDVLTYWLGVELVSGLILRSLVAGLLYVFFATCFIQRAQRSDILHIVAGALGMLTGISLMTVVFALAGLIFLTLFEVVLIVVIYHEFTFSEKKRFSHEGGVRPQML